jgi:hypothetical protein
MNVNACTRVKADNDIFQDNIIRNNEDAFKEYDKCVAMADGAGGIGILADQWAKMLVNKIPDHPFDGIKGIDKWLSGFWKEFYEKYRPDLINDAWKLKKFDSEGSLATLSVLWEIKPNEFIYQSYGDSVLFVFNQDKGTLEIQQNMDSLESFTLNPDLLNWKTEQHKEEAFYEQSIILNENESIIMATDGIAMYLFGAYLAYKGIKTDKEISNIKLKNIIHYYSKHRIDDFKKWIFSFKDSLKDCQSFHDLMYLLHKEAFLPNDDYTLIWVNRS